MTDQVGDGVRLSCARRPLDEDASLALQAHRDADLLGVGGLAEQHFLRLVSRLEGLGLLVLFGRGIETDDLEERQRQILADSEILERSLEGGGEAQGPRTEEEHGRAADLRVLGLLLRRAFGELPARRKLHHEAAEELERVGPAQRVESAPVQLLAAARKYFRLDVRHGAEEGRVQLHFLPGLDERELRHARVEGELDPLQQDGMVDAAVEPLPAEDAVAEHELDVLRLALDAAVELIQLLEDLHRRARGALDGGPVLLLGLPALVGFDASRLRVEAQRL